VHGEACVIREVLQMEREFAHRPSSLPGGPVRVSPCAVSLHAWPIKVLLLGPFNFVHLVAEQLLSVIISGYDRHPFVKWPDHALQGEWQNFTRESPIFTTILLTPEN